MTTEEGPGMCPQEDPDCEHSELQEDVTTEVPEGWYRLTNKACYKVEDGIVTLGYVKGSKIVTLLRTSVEDLKRLYNELPDEADASELRRLIEEFGMDSLYGRETYLLRLFANYVEFGGELIREGKTLKLIKDTQYLREENLRKLRQESEVIGAPWRV